MLMEVVGWRCRSLLDVGGVGIERWMACYPLETGQFRISVTFLRTSRAMISFSDRVGLVIAGEHAMSSGVLILERWRWIFIYPPLGLYD